MARKASRRTLKGKRKGTTSRSGSKRTRTTYRNARGSRRMVKVNTPKANYNDGARKEMSVFYDAFSNATAQPRVPDGKALSSMGHKNQRIYEIHNRQDEKNVVHILLYGGLGGGAIVCNTALTGVNPPNRAWTHMGYQDFGGFKMNDFETLAIDDTQSDSLNITNVENFSKWRLVSQGLRLKLVNPAEEDDGWWEAVRLSECLDEDDWVMTTRNDLNDWESGDDVTVSPYGQWILGTLGTRELTNHASYSNGRLKDIHKSEFQLKPIGDDLTFQDLSDKYNTPYKKDSAPSNICCTGFNDTGHREFRFNRGNIKANRLIKDLVDWNHDMVYIRLHTRPHVQQVDGTASGTANGSRVLAHLVANHEVMYQPTEKEAKFQSVGNRYAAFDQGRESKSRGADGGSSKAAQSSGEEDELHDSSNIAAQRLFSASTLPPVPDSSGPSVAEAKKPSAKKSLSADLKKAADDLTEGKASAEQRRKERLKRRQQKQRRKRAERRKKKESDDEW